jgi:hypothetical protein
MLLFKAIDYAVDSPIFKLLFQRGAISGNGVVIAISGTD